MYKTGLTAVVLAVLACVQLGQVSAGPTCSSSGPHNLTLGTRQYGDTLLYSSHEVVDSSFMRTQSKDIVYPASGQPAYSRITRIEVLNQIRNNGDAGCAFLTAGGPGAYGTTVHIKTQRGGAYDFVVFIYGIK